MRLSAIFKIVGPVIVVIGAAMLLSACVSLWYGESPMPLVIGGLSATVFGALCMIGFRHVDTHTMGMREGCAVATFSWIFACLFGALPFYVMGWFDSPTTLSFTKSYYEIMSGLTTTGASILTDVEIIPKGILFWRSFSHWFGGMGIVVFAVAMLPKLGVGGMQAFRWEAPGPLKADKLVPRIQDTAKLLYTVYMVITVLELVALLAVGVKLFDALCYTFGTVGTGGFGIHNTSVAGLHNPAAEWIIAFFMWLSGVNFGLTYLLLFKGQIKNFFRDAEFRAYLGISGLATVAIAFAIWGFNDWSLTEAFRYAYFQVSTIITTTGYATYDYNTWPVFPIAVLVIMMFIGGSTGSTGGGPKVLRHVISWKFVWHEILKLSRPNLVTTIKVGGRAISDSVVLSVMGMLFLYFTIFFVSGIILTFLEPDIDLISAFTGSIANLGNIGPGLNIVGPAGNFSSFSTPSLWLLAFEMLLGRLEIFTVLMLLLPSTWMREKRA